MKQPFLIRFLCLACSSFLLSAALAQDTTQYIIPNRQNAAAQQQKPYVILISVDGFRYDLADKYNATHLKQLRAGGVQAISMQPSYPSLIFPNHYSIITGLYPAHHGIVDNRFYDPQRKQFYRVRDKKAVRDASWYGGEPLWVLAEKQQMLSASFYWVGSESPIDGFYPTYYYNYNEAIPIDRRIAILHDWLEKPAVTRPHFITFYFPQVDHQAHAHGVEAKETAEAVQLIDRSIGQMVAMCAKTKLPINFIFVSDHGFTDLDTNKTMPLPRVIDTSKFIISYGGELTHLYAKDKASIKPTYKALKKIAKNYTPYRIDHTPRRWHYRTKDNKQGRLGDIILVPNPPYSFNFGGRKLLGAHGFDNRLPEMQATFYAWGPAFKQHYKIKSFENVNIYPMIAHILGLKIDEKIDGKFRVLKKILK